jgi:hypothetical protein
VRWRQEAFVLYYKNTELAAGQRPTHNSLICVVFSSADTGTIGAHRTHGTFVDYSVAVNERRIFPAGVTLTKLGGVSCLVTRGPILKGAAVALRLRRSARIETAALVGDFSTLGRVAAPSFGTERPSGNGYQCKLTFPTNCCAPFSDGASI